LATQKIELFLIIKNERLSRTEKMTQKLFMTQIFPFERRDLNRVCSEGLGWFMVYGLWFMVYGLWFMVYGLWFT
jgi:hypothetical protein